MGRIDPVMTFDTNTIIILVAILAALIALFLIMRSRSSRTIERKDERKGEPYVASRERPYMKAREADPAGGDGPQGNSIADGMATATADVAGDVLSARAREELPGAVAHPDDLTRLKGVGPKFAARLNELGLHRYEQIASLNENEVASLDDRLGPFRGRLARDRVQEQADYLARGDTEGFEARFGKLGG
jgi:predicted flap endonuclease-1-like 5' DNA nuclease